MPKTVLVTGATGYIAKHIVLHLLNSGYSVVGSTRSLARETEMHDALRPHLTDDAALSRLRMVALDLSRDDGWQEAMQGVDVLIHTASPFPITQPSDENELIGPAVEGALRAVRAARQAGITRVVMTSSTAAIMTGDLPRGQVSFNETNWSDPDHPSATAYSKSKTLAERAVWDWQAAEAPGMRITMINPGFVLGAPLDSNFGTSIKVIARLLKGKDPMVPDIGFVAVDVGDIAAMHVRAMENEATVNRRYAGVETFVTFQDIAQTLKDAYPDRKIATRVAPNMMIRFLSLFDPSIRTILPSLGRRDFASNERARTEMGVAFRDVRQSIRESGAYLVDNKLV